MWPQAHIRLPRERKTPTATEDQHDVVSCCLRSYILSFKLGCWHGQREPAAHLAAGSFFEHACESAGKLGLEPSRNERSVARGLMLHCPTTFSSKPAFGALGTPVPGFALNAILGHEYYSALSTAHNSREAETMLLYFTQSI